MRNPEWVSLTDSQRGQLVAIWLLAADHNGVIPTPIRRQDDANMTPKRQNNPINVIHDAALMVQRLCMMESKPNLQLFMQLGFITLDANMTPTRRQDDAPETDTDTDTDTDPDLDINPKGGAGGGEKNVRTKSAQESYIKPKRVPKASKPPILDSDQLTLFTQFWDAYPRGEAKSECMKAWGNLIPTPTPELLTEILTALKWQIPEWELADINYRFTPTPLTYINQRRWDAKPNKRLGQTFSTERNQELGF